ncbi:MAG: ABC transporter permease [Alphaproteobacteria bacterium]|jgi:simple sugar transport system permease protein|nr:ABC transporter permease [Alphaproteobacteria bacterium]MDP6563521.1 ABC transporter permease [Alphaproteobacteria bacterium]MDP6815859.1 ABC transporter permease [Alphaproteobacteria bacterium]
MASTTAKLPVWADVVLLPLINVALAFLVSGLLIAALGQDPFEATWILVRGAFGYEESLGYTFYYTTNFIFTGLAVAVAFHAMLFNIGGEGQAYIGGLGVGLACLALDQSLPFILLLPICIVGAALFGAAWAFIPAYLQAKRGSHIVITTIMFNFIAASVMVYLLANVLIKPGQMSPESREFASNAWLPFMHEALAWFGIEVARSPLNLSLVWALICCVGVWALIWHTRWGYEIRSVGSNVDAAVYAGIAPARIIIIAMCLSGGLAGFVGINEIIGVQHRLLLDFSAGYGFTGIAVSLMGRNHPVGIVLASLLFGALYQGGAELSFENPAFTPDLVVVIQGLVVLFSGALSYMLRPTLERLFQRFAAPALVEA